MIVAEDNDVIRNHYIDLLKYEPDIELLDWASNSSDAIRCVLQKKPNVVLMDIEMELNDSGITATKKILESMPDTRIIMLTVHDDEASISRAFMSGATNYIVKTASSIEIINAIKDAYMEESKLSPYITSKVIKEFKKMKIAQESQFAIVNILYQLTKTEILMLLLLNDNKTQSEISKIRNIELTTVKTHVKSILKKFNKKKIKEVLDIINTCGLTDYLKYLVNINNIS